MKSLFRFNLYFIFILLFLFSCELQKTQDQAQSSAVNTESKQNDPPAFDSIPVNAISLINTIDPKFGTYSPEKKNDFIDSILLDGLTVSQKIEILLSLNNDNDVEPLRVSSPISENLYSRLLDPRDGMNGVIHRWSEVAASIEALKISDPTKFNSGNDFFIYSCFAKLPAIDLIIPPNQQEPELREKLLFELKLHHKDSYDDLMAKDEIVNEQDLLDRYFKDKWSIVNAIGYEDSLILSGSYLDVSGRGISTKFDVGAVCPPICPKERL